MAFLKKILPAESDSELVLRYKSVGDIDILGELYSRYMELVYGVCLKYLKEPEDAKDAVINIFEELVVKVKKYEIDNFKPWLYQLAKNHCLMKLRSKKGTLPNVAIDLVYLTEENHLDKVIDKELRLSGMQVCIEELPPDQKQAIKLFYMDEKCYKEVAEISNTEITKVRSFIQNGRRNLKICMDKLALQKA